MLELDGSWTLDYLGPGATKAAYRIKVNPGGSIPAWLANTTTKEIPFNTMLGLMNMVKKQKYISAGKKIRDGDGNLFQKFFNQSQIKSGK